jgi:hypothetical protein
MADQPLDRKSTQIFNYLGVPEEQRIDEATMNAIAGEIRRVLDNLNSDKA